MNSRKTYVPPDKMGRLAAKPTSSGSNSALAAVALQDHLFKNLSLVDPLKKKTINHGSYKKQMKKVKPVVDTRLRQGGGPQKKKLSQDVEQKEFVLGEKPKPLTLAQKMGLVDSPEQPLTDNAWQHMKMKSNERDDSVLPCVICKEDFGLQQQVLLSCSHVFHRNCLQAFERFTGKKTCPMCRKQEYQTRVIHEGAKFHRVKCVIRIQACWRGYVVRSWYQKLRETVPPKDPKLRKKFYEGKMKSLSERLLTCYDTRVDDFLSEIDRSVAASRNVFGHLDSSVLRNITDEEWTRIQLQAVQRGHTECPICLTHLDEAPDQLTNNNRGDNGGDKRQTLLLSCTHVFHQRCLEAFEELALSDHQVCPVCRSGYQKRTL